jgi:hypothetical protein
LRFSPRPNLPEESAIKPGTAQVMQQASDLILTDPLGSMAQRRSHRCAHTRSPHRMRPIIPANDAARVSWVRVIIETHQPGQERTGNQERGMCESRSYHELEYTRRMGYGYTREENIVR